MKHSFLLLAGSVILVGAGCVSQQALVPSDAQTAVTTDPSVPVVQSVTNVQAEVNINPTPVSVQIVKSVTSTPVAVTAPVVTPPVIIPPVVKPVVKQPAPVVVKPTPKPEPKPVVEKPVVPAPVAPAPVVVQPVVPAPVVQPTPTPEPVPVPAPVASDTTLFTETQFTLQIPKDWQGGDNKVSSIDDASVYFYYAIIDLNMISGSMKAQLQSGNILAIEEDGIAHRCSDGSGCPTMTSHETVTIGGATGLHWTTTASTGAKEEWYMLVKGNTAYRFWGSGTVVTSGIFQSTIKTFAAK